MAVAGLRRRKALHIWCCVSGSDVLRQESCPRCGADLTQAGAVDYAERYSASLDVVDEVPMVVADAFTIDSSAKCSACGKEIPFTTVDTSSGGFLG